MTKKRKKRRKRFPTSHFSLLTNTFTVKQCRHVMLCIQHYMKTVHFWLKYNGHAIVRKTTKLIEGGHRGFRTIGIYVITSTFFNVFYVFFKIKKVVIFTFFLLCFVRFLELCCISVLQLWRNEVYYYDGVQHDRKAEVPG